MSIPEASKEVAPSPAPTKARPAAPSAAPALIAVLLTFVAGVVAFALLQQRHMPGPAWLTLLGTLLAVYVEQRYLPGLRERWGLRNARREGKRLLKAVRTATRKQRDWNGSEMREKIEQATAALASAVAGQSVEAIEEKTKALDELADQTLTRKPAFREYAEQIGGALLVAALLRAFFYEAFKIPSSSMVPTLLIGDHLFVNKFVYGLQIPFTTTKFFARLPERGDIVVFNRPQDEAGDAIIKRVIGLPGDVIEVRSRHVTVNGEPLVTHSLPDIRLNGDGDNETETETGPFHTVIPFQETVGTHQHIAVEIVGAGQAPPNEGRWVVQKDHVFVMGDNRDNSQDSRFGLENGGFGQVPINYLKGRADIIWLSLGGPHGVRMSRMFKLLH